MNSQFIFFADKEIGEQIGPLKQEMIYPFWSNGRWAMHDMLSWLLKQTGPAEVQLSTFSISEVALRSLAHEIEIGMIEKLECLFDYTIQQNKLQLLFFASQLITNIRITPNHSKIILIENEFWKIVVIGSANMTPNPRKEAGVIITDKEVFKKMQKQFEIIMQESKQIDYEKTI